MSQWSKVIPVNWMGNSRDGNSTSLATPILLSLATFLVLLNLIEYRMNKNLRNFPPGPRSSFMFVRKFWHFFVTSDVRFLPPARQYVAEYGKVLGLPKSLLTGFKQVVIINDAEVLREAFNNPGIIARPHIPQIQMYNDGKNRGMICLSGKPWKEIRQFTMSQLHSRGFGMKKLEPVITDEATVLVQAIREIEGRPIFLNDFFNVSAFNVLWQLVSSQRMELNDPLARSIIHQIGLSARSWKQMVMLSVWPRITYWTLKLLGKNVFLQGNTEFLQFSSKFVEGRTKDFEQGQRLYDFTDAFIEKIKGTTDVDSPFYGQFGYENLNELLRDFFLGGTGTTGATTAWAMLYLALHPEVQEKVHGEIDRVLEGRAPTLDDKPKMKYMEAVILETLRRSSNVPMGVPHATSQDVQIGKYSVPKGTMVSSGLYAIHHCEETWGDPYEFRPQRFLSEDGQRVLRHDSFVPFGVGKRRCPGATLAMDELFIFITSILQEFTSNLNPEEPRPNMGSKLGQSFDPNPHTLIFHKRPTPQLRQVAMV